MKVILDKESICLKIKENRLKKNLSIEDLAKKTSISAKTLRNYEHGINIPKLNNFIKLCNFYNIKFDELIIYKLV